MIIVTEEIRGHRKQLYAAKKQEVKVVATHGQVLILENLKTKEKFPCGIHKILEVELVGEDSVATKKNEMPKFVQFEGAVTFSPSKKTATNKKQIIKTEQQSLF